MEFLFNSPGKGKAAAHGKAAAPASPWVKDGTTASFMADVMDASMQVPVIVDFWASWAGPCKTLTPLLEKLVNAAKGAVRLVKVDVEENQQLVAQMRIQSVPAVYAFKGGRPVDGIVGSVTDGQVKAFVDRLTGGSGAEASLDEALEQAKELLAAGDAATAAQIFQEVLEVDPVNALAWAGLLRCLLATGDLAGAKETLAQVPPESARHPEIVGVRTTLELAEQAGASAGASAELRRRVAADPDDHQARFDLALAYYAAGEREAAVEELLDVVKRDRTWHDDGARKQLVKLFEAFGPTDPLTLSARRRLSSLLFA